MEHVEVVLEEEEWAAMLSTPTDSAANEGGQLYVCLFVCFLLCVESLKLIKKTTTRPLLGV